MNTRAAKGKPRVFTARVRVTRNVYVEVVAKSREEAIEALKGGAWNNEDSGELIDWADPIDVIDTGVAP